MQFTAEPLDDDEEVPLAVLTADTLDYFLDEIQNNYWKVDTFAAFSRDEHALMRRALDDCQLDNNIATRMAHESKGWNPGECFLRSLAALGPVFRDVFGDE